MWVVLLSLGQLPLDSLQVLLLDLLTVILGDDSKLFQLGRIQVEENLTGDIGV